MSDEIRILHVLGDLGVGGIESLLISIYKNIDKSKIKFDFLVHNIDNKQHVETINKLGGNVYKIRPFSPKNPFKYHKDLNDFFKKHNYYKILHCHFRRTESTILKIAKEHSLITISHSHGKSLGSGIKALLRTYQKKDVIKYSDYRFACSKAAGKFLYGKNSFKIISNGIEVENYIFDEDIRNKLRSDFNLEDKYVLVNVGSLSIVKNQKFLLELLPSLLERDGDIRLLLVGDGPLKRELKEKTKSLKIEDKVTFLGSVNNVYDILQACDLFLLPSLSEGLPLSCVEAQASGLKCLLSSNVPEDTAITNNVNFIDLENKNKWKSSIIENKTYLRRNMYNEISDKGFNIKSTSKCLNDFYLNVVN